MKSPPTVYGRNLLRIMSTQGWRATRLSLEAGLGRTYVSEILSGRVVSPGADATNKLATVLRCDSSDLMRNGEPTPPDADRQKANRERALRAVERAMEGDQRPDLGAVIFRAADMVYDVVVEREATLNRPISDDDEFFWGTIDAMVRRWIEEMR